VFSVLSSYVVSLWIRCAVCSLCTVKDYTVLIQCVFMHCYKFFCTILHEVITNSMEQNPSSEARSYSAGREILRTYGPRKFITAFTSVRRLYVSSSRLHSSNSSSWISILIIYSHPHQGLPMVFPHVSPPKSSTHLSSLPHTCHMPSPSLFDMTSLALIYFCHSH
jgi:hypothetical protein